MNRGIEELVACDIQLHGVRSVNSEPELKAGKDAIAHLLCHSSVLSVMRVVV
jgi:hypothetical protein